MYAASAHCAHHQQVPRVEDFVTWRHLANGEPYQIDHVFTLKSEMQRFLNCKNQFQLCHTDHLAVKITIRVQVKLEKRPTPTDAEEMAKLDHSAIRPHTPRFDPSIARAWITAVETHVLENVDGLTHDRLQAAMIFACISIIPKRKKRSKHWYVPFSNILDPHVRWRNTCLGNWHKQQNTSVLLVTEEEKRIAVRTCNQHMRKYRALHIREEATRVEKAMKSN